MTAARSTWTTSTSSAERRSQSRWRRTGSAPRRRIPTATAFTISAGTPFRERSTSWRKTTTRSSARRGSCGPTWRRWRSSRTRWRKRGRTITGCARSSGRTTAAMPRRSACRSSISRPRGSSSRTWRPSTASSRSRSGGRMIPSRPMPTRSTSEARSTSTPASWRSASTTTRTTTRTSTASCRPAACSISGTMTT